MPPNPKTKPKEREAEKKKYFTVEEAIFHRKIHIFLNYSHKEFAEFARKKGATDYKDENYDDNFTAFSTAMETKNGPTEWVICLKYFNWSIGSQGTLIHEIVHTIIKIWQINNIPYNLDTQEFLAHSIGNLYEDIAAKIMNVKKIKR